MASSVNNCIQVLFDTGCSMRMSHSDGTWRVLDYGDAMQSLPKVNNAMSFLTRNNFIVGPNTALGTVAVWVSQNITIGFDGEIINNNNTAREGNIAVLGTLLAGQENFNISNCKTGEMNDFITMNSPWCLVNVIATNANENQKPIILSYHRRDHMGRYYLIESAAQEVRMFRFPDLAHLGNNFFTEQGRLNLVSTLRQYRPFANVSPAYVIGKVAHLVFVPKKYLNPPCEEYSAIEVSLLNTHFSNQQLTHSQSDQCIGRHPTFCSVFYQCRRQHYF